MVQRGHLAPVAALLGGSVVAREHLPREAPSVGAARLLVEDVLVEHALTDRSLVDAAVLLASELTTDAVRHGSGERLTVEVALGERRVQVTVTTPAPRRPGQRAPAVADHSQQVLDMIAEAWDVRVAGGERTGWCRLDRTATTLPPAPRTGSLRAVEALVDGAAGEAGPAGEPDDPGAASSSSPPPARRTPKRSGPPGRHLRPVP